MTPLILINYIKDLKKLSRAQIGRDTGISDYRLKRMFVYGYFGKDLEYLINVCEKSFFIHPGELLTPVSKMPPSTLVWKKMETANGKREKLVKYSEEFRFKNTATENWKSRQAAVSAEIKAQKVARLAQEQ